VPSPGEGSTVHRRHSRTLAVLASATVALGTSTIAGGADAAGPIDPGSPIALMAPDRVVAYYYGGDVYTNLGLRVVTGEDPFEIWSTRASYDEPIMSVWKGSGSDVELPPGTMTSFAGLPDFVSYTATKVSDGSLVKEWSQTACFNSYQPQRMRPDAPSRSPYPDSCPWNPYTVGSVMGIEEGYATSLTEEWSSRLHVKPGKYDVTASIGASYREMFGIADVDAEQTIRLVVKREGEDGIVGRPTAPRPAPSTLQPAAQEPGSLAPTLAPEGPTPDLRSLPAFAIRLNGAGTAVRFAATTWNGGVSPLVVDGFREEDEDHMDAYQYFFDTEGNQTGYAPVGEIHWHGENHQHWHFEDFARYRLLSYEMDEVVKSTKQSWCLANTDAVDYTGEGADWHPENTDLSTACGGSDALSIREVLSPGSGDTYFQYRYGQALAIDDVPDGRYWISVEANPMGNLIEADTENNDSLRLIKLRTNAAGERVVKVPPVGVIDEAFRF
jgi:hypothetical protein